MYFGKRRKERKSKRKRRKAGRERETEDEREKTSIISPTQVHAMISFHASPTLGRIPASWGAVSQSLC